MLSFVFTEDAFRVDRPEDVLTAVEEELKGVAPFFGSHTENHDCFGGFLCFLR